MKVTYLPENGKNLSHMKCPEKQSISILES